MIDGLHDGSAAALLRWWAVLALGTVAWFPLTARLWPGATAWAAARCLGWLATAYALWLPATWGWPLPAGAVALALALAALITARACGAGGPARPFAANGPLDWRQGVRDEGAFAALLLFWCVLRATRADLAGTEKFMDFGLLQACMQTGTLPPLDPWFAGETVNYYYFGHWLSAVLARVSHVDAAHAYNLMLATVAAQAMALMLALVRTLLMASGLAGRAASSAGGWLGALLLGFGGNLHPLLYGVLPALRSGLGWGPAVPGYFYPTASRFIGMAPAAPEHLIVEFPAYSFVVGDLHAHLLNLPLVLLLLILLLGELSRRRSLRSLAPRAVIALILGAMAMTNSWAFPVYGLLAGLAFASIRWQAGARGWRWATAALTEGALLAGAGLMAAAPFFLRFQPFNRGFALAESHTRLLDLAVLWGGSLVLVACFAAMSLMAAGRGQGPAAALRLAPVPALYLALVLGVALTCIAAAETVVVLDIYAPPFRRANTVFKLGYEAFVMLTVCAAVAATATVLQVSRLHKRLWPARLGLLTVVWLACSAPLAFAAYALPQGFGPFNRAMTLDALAGLARSQPDDRRTVAWLQSNVSPGTTVLEVDGFSYTYAGRIATATGLPTVLGWRAHEELWRKDEKQQIDQRGIDVERIYRADDCALASLLLQRYDVGYIVLGAYERERLPGLDERRLLRLASPAARFGSTQVLRLRPAAQRCRPDN